MNLLVANQIWNCHSKRWRNDLPQTSASYQFKYSKDIVVAAERNGFDSVYAYDHFIPHYRYPSAGSFF